MANQWFRKLIQAWMTGTSFDLTAADLRVVLVDTADDTPDPSIGGDDFLDDILAGAREAVTLQLQNVTVTDGVLDADDIALPDDGGDQAEVLVIYDHNGGADTARRLAIYIDSATGLPITPDSVADSIQWHASGIAAL